MKFNNPRCNPSMQFLYKKSLEYSGTVQDLQSIIMHTGTYKVARRLYGMALCP